MPRLLKIDPRPTTYDSVAEAVFASEDEPGITEDIECDSWRPLTPPAPARLPDVAFVDGVERRDARVSAEGERMPFAGMLVSYAAGAICPARQPPLRHVSVQRRIVLTNGATAETIVLNASNTTIDYLPAHNAEADAESIDRTLKGLRADLEAAVVRSLIVDGAELIVCDGRLPPIRDASAIGLIKTPHQLPLTRDDQLETLTRLRAGQRSPVFIRRRSDRAYYSWFVCLADLGPLDLALSNVALIEMDDEAPRARALAAADITAALLPPYAPTAYRDPRAPQNLMPVGQLERELRRRLGDPEMMRRLMLTTFGRESPTWHP
ncbi:MAG: hypothetical protein IVW36_03545 [Dehalococcoidia bacterium]|nr:hypothetical protein [Dehalococcoidia bacterium]